MLLDTPIKDSLPFNDYFDYYGPEYKLHLPVSNMENQNSAKYLEDIKLQVLKILDGVESAPGTQIFTGQIGTSQIPAKFDSMTTDMESGRGTADSYEADANALSGQSSYHHQQQQQQLLDEGVSEGRRDHQRVSILARDAEAPESMDTSD